MSIAYPDFPADADPALGPLLEGFLACLCGMLAQAGRPVCADACCLVPGDGPPPADRCDCTCVGGAGQAWVRWVESEPVQAPGGRAVRRGCTPLRTVKIIEAGVYRCVASPGDDGSPPSCEARRRDALGLVWDQRLLLDTFACCHVLERTPKELRRVVPTAVRGGCAGVVIQFAVEV